MPFTFKHNDRPLDDFTVQRAVGAGGFGEVYYAISDGGREVALKYLKSNPHVELRGVSHCINLKSPHLVSIFDVKKSADDEYFIIMEYCSGPSLRDLLIAEPNGFTPEKAAFFVREIAKGLAYLHDRGIVHRDLKPGNIFYDDGYVKIGDYGLSKFISVSRHSAQTASVGTVHYMAPEIGSGNYSRGVDIYALGVMLYEMLLGKVPFEGSSMAEVLMKHLTNQPAVDELPQPFGKIIRKALEKDPKDRYQTVDEMVEDLLAVDAVKDSLAGFSPQSLSGAVARGHQPMADSPMPSPNPYRAAIPPAPVPPPIGLPRQTAQRMDRISRKLDKRLAKLGGAAGDAHPPLAQPHRRHGHRERAGRQHRHKWDVPVVEELSRDDRRKRFTLIGLASVGIMLAGALLGASWGEEGAAAGFLLIALMAGAVMLSRRILAWLGEQARPWWARRLMQLLCACPLICVGAMPAINSRWEDEGTAVALALVFVAMFGNWRKHAIRGARGEAGLGSAIGTGIFALLWTLLLCGPMDAHAEWAVFAGMVTVGAALLVQGWSWALPTTGKWAIDPYGPQPTLDVAGEGVAAGMTVAPDEAETQVREVASPRPFVNVPREIESIEQADGDEDLDDADERGHTPPERWLVARVLWAFATFMFMAGSMVSLLLAAMSNRMTDDMRTATILACIACFAGMLFSFRRVGPYRQVGFWRDTLRPFLLCLALTGLGFSITALACGVELAPAGGAESAAVAITGIVLFSAMLIVFLALRGKPVSPASANGPARRGGRRAALAVFAVITVLMLLAVFTWYIYEDANPARPFCSLERMRHLESTLAGGASHGQEDGLSSAIVMVDHENFVDGLADAESRGWTIRPMTEIEMRTNGSSRKGDVQNMMAEDHYHNRILRLAIPFEQHDDGRRVPHGIARSFWETGVHRAELTYVHGTKHGPARTWYRDGVHAVEGNYRGGLQHGTWKVWNRDGTLAEQCGMNEGLRHGMHMTFGTGGRAVEQRTYHNGKSIGVVTTFDGSGKASVRVIDEPDK